ncbi:MAG: hypothetical protein ABFR63_11450, partial [Thermodesulfobacteriota bacterium]
MFTSPPRALIGGLFLLLLFCAAPVSGGGQSLGINLAGLHDWNSELPFVDLFRLSRTWVSQENGKPWGKGPALVLDEHGWITRLAPETWAESCILNIRSGQYPKGTYTLLHKGRGKIEIGNVGGRFKQTPGKVEFTLNGEENIVWIGIKETDPEDYIRDIRVFIPGYGESPPTDILRPGFLKRWQGMDVVRYMEFMDVNNSRIQHWDDRVRLDDSTWTIHGAPIEMAIEISNRLQAAPWFSIPHLADNTYVRRFAELVRDRLDPELKIYLEYSNETWNPMFDQTRYCREQGIKMGLSTNPVQAGLRFASLRSIEIFHIWQQVFGDSKRLVMTMAGQAASTLTSEEKLKYRDAWKEVDALAIAPYMTLNVSPRSTPSQQEVRQWSLDRLLQEMATSNFNKAMGWVRESKKLADRYHVALIGYEGGQHMVGMLNSENDEQLTALFHAANRSEEMGRIYS